MQNEINSTYIISKERNNLETHLHISNKNTAISQQNPAVVYAKSFQIVIQRQFV